MISSTQTDVQICRSGRIVSRSTPPGCTHNGNRRAYEQEMTLWSRDYGMDTALLGTPATDDFRLALAWSVNEKYYYITVTKK